MEEIYKATLQSQMSYYNDYTFTTNQLQIAEKQAMPVVLPKNKSLTIAGKIYELKN